MTRLNITLNQEEILQLFSNDRAAAFAKFLQDNVNSIQKIESTAQLRAEPYERTKERTVNRNGFRDRPLTTRTGKHHIRCSAAQKRRGIPYTDL